MATVEVFTKARMQEIEDRAVVNGEVRGDELILIRNDDTEINAGNVRGPQGTTPVIPPETNEIDWFTRPAEAQIAGTGPVGSGNAQPLRMQAGSTVIVTNTVGRQAITFPALFNGVASVIAQIGDAVDVYCTHYAGTPAFGTQLVEVGNINVVVDGYANSGFHVNLYASGGITGAGTQEGDAVLGGIQSPGVRINWMAFGW